MKRLRLIVVVCAALTMAACSSEASLPGFRGSGSQTAATPSATAQTVQTPEKATTPAKPTPAAPTLTPTPGHSSEEQKQSPQKPEDQQETQQSVQGAQQPGPATDQPFNQDGAHGVADVNSPDGGPDCEKVKCVAFTFDDGPGAHTQDVLNALNAAQIKGTFFEIGRNVAGNPDMTKRVAAEGNAIGGHSWNHPQLTKLSSEKAAWQISATSDALGAALGVKPGFMRPPYGAANSRIFNIMAQQKVASIMWSVDTLDWKYKSVDKSLEIIRKELKPGGIILMHDIHPVAQHVIPIIVQEYRAKGYHFVTIPQMFKSRGLIPGRRYFSQFDIRG